MLNIFYAYYQAKFTSQYLFFCCCLNAILNLYNQQTHAAQNKKIAVLKQ